MSDEIKESVAVEETAAPAASAEPTMAEVFHDPNAPIITMKKCLEAGVHFGHQTHRWNPKMGKYIYGARNGIYIIDLNKTVERTILAYQALKAIVEAGGKVLFVGTKAQAQQIVIDEAVRSGSFYITNRWLGGTLTNWRTIASRIKRLRDLDAAQTDGSWDKLPKKEVALLRKEYAKLDKNLGGLKEMRRLPQAIVLADPSLEKNAALEARKLNIPVFALCDTNDDPEIIDFPVPTNNDATSAIKLIVGVLADAVVEARAGVTEFAYTKDEGEEATMAAARKAREERYAKMRAEREARFQARRAEAAKKADAAKETK